jgi:hypothetical protein
MNDSSRRSDLFRRSHRQRSSPMRFAIAVALSCLSEKSLSRALSIRPTVRVLSQGDCGSMTRPGSGRVSMNNLG